MRTFEALIIAARYATVMAGIFLGVIAMGYVSLMIWDRTHQPSIPGWVSAPPAGHHARPAQSPSHA